MGILEHLHEARADLQDRVCELLEERDELTKERDMASSRVQALRSTIHRLIDDNEALEAERDELRAAFLAGEFPPNHTPRVITADELREGQLICIHRWHGWGVRAIGEFQGVEGDVVTIKTGGSGTFTGSVKFHTIVLLADEPATNPCTFALVRDEDETGVSGTGKVAEGVIYSDGHVSMRWIVGEHRSTVAYDSVESVEAIHGHGGKTRIVVEGEE